MTYILRAAFTTYMQLEKAAQTMIVQKIRTFNVDEIDTWCTRYRTTSIRRRGQSVAEKHKGALQNKKKSI